MKNICSYPYARAYARVETLQNFKREEREEKEREREREKFLIRKKWSSVSYIIDCLRRLRL